MGGRAVEFSIAAAEPPAGVYEARVRVGGLAVGLGRAVSADGTSVGVQNRDGEHSPAPPPLMLPAATSELDGVLHTAELRDGDDAVPGS